MIKNFIKKITTPTQRTQIERVMKRTFSRKKNINIYCKYKRIASKTDNVFFGYYDLNPFSDGKMTYLMLDKQQCCSIILKLHDGYTRKVGSTQAWCWQQGCRLRWKPNSKLIIQWNDFDGQKYISKSLHLDSELLVEHPLPLYDVSNDGKYGATLDFNRLGYDRPGYGYRNLPYSSNDTVGGILICDLDSFTTDRVITYNEVISLLNEDIDLDDCYFNHLSFSPKCRYLLFFFLTKGKIHKARLGVYDVKSRTIRIIETNLSVSHYCWIDDDSILVTAYDEKRICRYYVYGVDGERHPFVHDVLHEDGHPTWIDDNTILTDTYPDDAGFQKILIINRKTKDVRVIADVYSTAKYLGERRTDLHPRYDRNSGKICFDVNSNGNREIYILEAWK